MQVCAFATSEDAADVAVTHTACDVAVVMHAATQASVATSVVRQTCLWPQVLCDELGGLTPCIVA